MNIVNMQPDHLVGMAVQKKQLEVIGIVSPEYASDLIRLGPAFAGIVDDKVVACGGCAELWKERHMMWAILSDAAGPHLFKIKNAALRLMSMQVGRLEAYVRTDFPEGHRFAKMCGLRWHHHEERFLPGGIDADVYVRFC
jgi:hypothetical protein